MEEYGGQPIPCGDIANRIAQVFRCGVLYRNKLLEQEDLNGYQHTYILAVCDNPGITQDQLAQAIYVNKSNVTRQLSLLEQNGYVTRRIDDKDKRALRVYPTEKAVAVYPRVQALMRQWDALISEGLLPEEKEQFAKILERVKQNALRVV